MLLLLCFYFFLSHPGLYIANIGWLDYSNRFRSTITIVLLSVLFLLYMFCCYKLLPTASGYYKSQYWHCLSFGFKQKLSHLFCYRVSALLSMFSNEKFVKEFLLLYFLFSKLKLNIFEHQREKIYFDHIFHFITIY